jgi:hypothetical protein
LGILLTELAMLEPKEVYRRKGIPTPMLRTMPLTELVNGLVSGNPWHAIYHLLVKLIIS